MSQTSSNLEQIKNIGWEPMTKHNRMFFFGNNRLLTSDASMLIYCVDGGRTIYKGEFDLIKLKEITQTLNF